MIIDPVEMTTLAVVTFLAFTIAGVTGFGGGLFVMPVLLLMMEPREAGPIIGLVQLVAAASRTGLNWEGISWPIVKRLALTSLPIAAAASYLFVVTPGPHIHPHIRRPAVGNGRPSPHTLEHKQRYKSA